MEKFNKKLREIKKIVKKGEEPVSYKETMIEINKLWADPTYWYSFNQMVNERSSIYYWNALDRTYNEEGDVILQDEKRRMYIKTWIRTLKVSVYVTFFCLILGFPLLIY